MSGAGRACALAALLAAGLASAEGAPSPSLAGYGWLADLAGACWRGDHPDGKTSDTQCYEASPLRVIRGTIKVSREGAPVFEGEGVFSDSGPGRRVLFTQWGTAGAYATGQMTFEGEALVFRNLEPSGELSPVRHVWRRTAPDAFRVTRERDTPAKGWSPILEVQYRRVPRSQ